MSVLLVMWVVLVVLVSVLGLECWELVLMLVVVVVLVSVLVQTHV